jgi:hypothetical protein
LQTESSGVDGGGPRLAAPRSKDKRQTKSNKGLARLLKSTLRRLDGELDATTPKKWNYLPTEGGESLVGGAACRKARRLDSRMHDRSSQRATDRSTAAKKGLGDTPQA